MKRFRWIFLLLCSMTSFAPVLAQANEPDNRFGGWEFIEINHNFKQSRWFVTEYFEHDNFQYKRLDCWYNRVTAGYNLLPWLKTAVNYDILRDPDAWTHRAVFDLTGTLKQQNLKVSVRERYIHSWTPELDNQGDVLRSRLKVQYHVPKTSFSPYVAIEVFTWDGNWQRSRHYLACTYDITKHVQLEGYYMYYTYKNKPSEHIIGLGINLDI